MSSVVFITGATSGIGAQLARDYADDGWQVWACGRNQTRLEQLAAASDNIHPLAFDITDVQACREAVEALDPAPDTWILNAGDCEYINQGIMDAGLFRRVIDTNVIGLVNTIEAIQQHFVPGHHLVIVGSISSELALPRAEAYGASKAAVAYLARTLGLDLASKGVLVSTVYPGFVRTPLTDKNDFPMPMIVTAERASQDIRQGIADKKRTIYFPKRFTWIIRLLGSLPYSVQHPIIRRLIKEESS